MSGNEIASFIYLAILGSVIAAFFLMANRQRMGQLAQQAVIWALIFVGVAAGAALWQDIRATAPGHQAVVNQAGRVEVTRSADGHFHLELGVNGTPVRFLLDTGASDIVLTRADARRAGLDPEALRFTGRAATANGVVATAPIRLQTLTLGDWTAQDVPARVSDGQMPGSLLGMAFLDRFAAITIAGDRLTLQR